jgi:hypothetical protein
MAQIRENWTDIRGTIMEIRDMPGKPGMVLVTAAVAEAREVEGFADFLSALAGHTAVIIMPVETARRAGCSAGKRLKARVRRGRNQTDIFAHTESVACG